MHIEYQSILNQSILRCDGFVDRLTWLKIGSNRGSSYVNFIGYYALLSSGGLLNSDSLHPQFHRHWPEGSLITCFDHSTVGNPTTPLPHSLFLPTVFKLPKLHLYKHIHSHVIWQATVFPWLHGCSNPLPVVLHAWIQGHCPVMAVVTVTKKRN